VYPHLLACVCFRPKRRREACDQGGIMSRRSGRADFRHPVRPVRASPCRWAIREACVDSLLGLNVPASVRPTVPRQTPPFPSPGSPRYRFPCFCGTMRVCDFLGPSHRASLSFAWWYHPVRLLSVAHSARRRPGAWSFGSGSPTPAFPEWRRQDLSGSWRTLLRLCRVLGPRRDQNHQAVRWSDAAPSLARPKATRG
jgi:hypothetical protein